MVTLYRKTSHRHTINNFQVQVSSCHTINHKHIHFVTFQTCCTVDLCLCFRMCATVSFFTWEIQCTCTVSAGDCGVHIIASCSLIRRIKCVLQTHQAAHFWAFLCLHVISTKIPSRYDTKVAKITWVKKTPLFTAALQSL